MSSSASFCGENSDNEINQRGEIRRDLAKMSFEEIMKLKDELGAKVYKEAMLGVVSKTNEDKTKDAKTNLKRLNKNRPREVSTKRQVPFLGAELRSQSKNLTELRDPRFDEASGTYDVKSFKNNYKFVTKIRQKEATVLKNKLNETADGDERKEITQAMQKLLNKNVEERNWHSKQAVLKQEQQETQRAHTEGRQPHYMTKKERRAKELVTKFEDLKKSGKLNKHLEKRRKKNAAKDRRRLNFD